MPSVGLSERQHDTLETVKDLFEEDFGRKISYGELIWILATGYLEGRSVILGQAQQIIGVVEESSPI